jgi:hypothetical protein
MRYFTRIIDNPNKPNYKEPRSLHRFVEDGSSAEYFQDGKWVSDPDLLLFSGLGGDNDYIEIDINQAQSLYQKFGGEGKLDK